MTKIQKKKDDPAIGRVRKARHEVSAEHGHDPKRVVDYYIRRQQDREQRSNESEGEKES